MTVNRHIGAFQHARTHTQLINLPSCLLASTKSIFPIYIDCSYAYRLSLTHSALIRCCTFASRPIWSSVRRLLVRPGVVVGSPPSPSTPGQTFRSCMPWRNMLLEDFTMTSVYCLVFLQPLESLSDQPQITMWNWTHPYLPKRVTVVPPTGTALPGP